MFKYSVFKSKIFLCTSNNNVRIYIKVKKVCFIAFFLKKELDLDLKKMMNSPQARLWVKHRDYTIYTEAMNNYV